MVSEMNDDFYTVNEIAEIWGLTPRWVRTLCAQKKIEGVAQFGKVWAIPKDAKRPEDGRVKTGKYKNWRKDTQGE